MPNWCDNTVMIKGSEEEIAKVKKALEGEDNNVFSFQSILPCPAPLLTTTAPAKFHANEQKINFNIQKYGAADWYDWKNANWGTKWDSNSAVVISQLRDQIAYGFSTAWAPPFPIYDKLAEMFPNTNIFINYDESGCSFSGWRYYENGELTKEVEYEDSYHSRRMYMEPDSDIWEWLE